MDPEAYRHRAWVEIDHAAIAANLALLRQRAGEGTQVIGVVKANAYGHGAVEVAATLIDLNVERLAVATVSEATELRDAGLGGPILVLWGGFDQSDAEAVARANLEPIVDGAAAVAILGTAAAATRTRLGVHLKVDSGLGRQGIEPESALELAGQIAASRHLHLAGTMTHLAAPEDESHTETQLDRMASVLDAMRASGIDPGIVHVGGTGAILAGVGTDADAVRPGVGLYGLCPDPFEPATAGLTPALALRALPLRVVEVASGTPIGYGMRWTARRTCRLATLPIGYGDGWPRSHLNNGSALVRGQRAPMVGAISMDGLVVDVSDAGSVGLDDEFVLIGRQGDDEITADEVAAQRGTINYEVTTMLRRRLPRRHVNR